MYKQSDFVLTDDWMVNSQWISLNIIAVWHKPLKSYSFVEIIQKHDNDFYRIEAIWNAKTTQFPVEGARFLSEDCFPTAEEVHSFLKPFSQKQEDKRREEAIVYNFSRFPQKVQRKLFCSHPKTLICICLIKKIRIIQS